MNDLPKAHPAGGVATQKGINYQNRGAAALAVACISETAPGIDLPTPPIRVIRCESGEPVGGDILLELADGALLLIEVKRSIRLSDGRFAALVEQLIKQFMACEQSLSNDSKPWRRPLRSGIDRLQVITSSESPEAVRKHLAACLDRIGPGAEPSELLGVAKNNAEDNAYTLFKSLVTAGWKDLLGEQLSDSQLIRFASVVVGDSPTRGAILSPIVNFPLQDTDLKVGLRQSV
ncbi:hypothetical protein [Tunturiibacter gelidiferens]|uniref:hypothetical protein n=1 Tax=Tunturiibacter gelidiferens TaxID=3069689 RepID=UPI003D9BE83D